MADRKEYFKQRRAARKAAGIDDSRKEQERARRVRLKAAGTPAKGGKGRKKTLFDDGVFIAIDGEGGEVNGVHQYQLLGATGEDSLYCNEGLSTKQCFEYLIDLKINNPMGIFVIFSGSYDGNFWLRDLPQEKIKEINANEDKYFTDWQGYRIKFVQRRKFELWSTRLKKSIVIYDVFSFFQSSFVQALKTWLPNHALTELIIEGKARRTNFTADEIDFIEKYNNAENEALVLIMDKLRDAIKEMDLKLSNWFGAGSIASAIYKKVKIKHFMPAMSKETKRRVLPLNDDLYDGIKRAYFGGRIEIGKFGHHTGKIYHYDINSAYPAAMADLPDLSDGEWIHAGACDPREINEVLVISKIEFSYHKTSALYPLPIRSDTQLLILFPREGLGWYWKPEAIEALNFCDKGVKVLDCYYWKPTYPDVKPFDFVPEYYATRQALVAESKRSGVPNGVEKGIKLGLNSLYGKLAQRIGYDPEKNMLPPYHNLEWAGHITSATRAKLFSAANQSPDNIICLATDGVYSLEPLALDCPKEKILGGWEFQTHEAMTIVQSGVYFLHDEGGKVEYYARGFDKITSKEGILALEDQIREAWRTGAYHIIVPCTRLITMKAALIGGVWWERWLSWHEFKTKDGESGRQLSIRPGSKRYTVYDSLRRAHKQMLPTEACHNIFPEIMSGEHGLPWDIFTNPSDDDKAFDLTEDDD